MIIKIVQSSVCILEIYITYYIIQLYIVSSVIWIQFIVNTLTLYFEIHHSNTNYMLSQYSYI